MKTKIDAEAEINEMMLSSVNEEGQKFWFCGVCNFSYREKIKVFKHVDSKHYEFGLSCDICGKKSATLNSLQQHYRSNHK